MRRAAAKLLLAPDLESAFPKSTFKFLDVNSLLWSFSNDPDKQHISFTVNLI
jgi:hypothetical protein